MTARENKCQILQNDILHEIFRILHVFSQFLHDFVVL